MTGVGVILHDVSGSGEAAGGVDGGHCGQRAADDFLGCVCHFLQPLPVGHSAVRVPDRHGVRQQALYGGAVESHQQLLVESLLPEHPQEVQSLLGLFD